MDNIVDWKPNANFLIANRYLGWGDVTSGLWFIGLEESLSWTAEHLSRYSGLDREIDPCEADTDFASLGRKGSHVRSFTSRIAVALSSKMKDREWREYRTEQLWRPNCGLLHLNLFPLGKARRAEWPDSFESDFGLGVKDRPAYENYVARTRFNRIRQLWREIRPKAVVAFGKEGWRHCQSIFDLFDNGAEFDGGHVIAYEKERVVMAPFFGYGHMTILRAELIAALLKKWNVSIP